MESLQFAVVRLLVRCHVRWNKAYKNESVVFTCHLGCGMEQVADDTGLVLEFLPANKNKFVPTCFRRAEASFQCCKHGPRKGRGKAPFRNKMFLYFDYLTSLTREVSWCTIAFSLCWSASERRMLLSKMLHVQTAVLTISFCWLALWVAFDP